MKYYGICPSSCGEFVQGIINDEEYLSSYAIDKYSIVTLEEKIKDISIGPKKSRKAIEVVFKLFNLPIEESKNISLKINSDIPIGKGMSSSTADIGATIMATLQLIGENLSSEEISKLATNIEPTDSLYIEENSIFNPLNGEVIKYLGKIRNAKVIVLEPKTTLNTEIIRKTPDYKNIKLENKEIVSEAFYLLEEGIRQNNLYTIGKACTLSSLANENIHEKQGIRKIIEISQKYGAYGVNVAHSGTVVGILIDDYMNDLRLIDLLKQSNLQKFYSKMYTHKIIDTGIRIEL